MQAVVKKNKEVLLKSYYKDKAMRKMYTHYQNMWKTIVANEQIKKKYNDVSLVNFLNETKERYSPNIIWVIFSCINADFIERFGVD